MFRKTLSILILSSLILGQRVGAQALVSNLDDLELGRNIDQFINYIVETEKFSGNVLVKKDNTTILKKSYGYRDAQAKEALEVGDKMPIGSVTKEFLTLSILQLDEAGLLSTRDRLDQYFPDYKFGKDIRIENLLVHNSGIKELVEGDSISFLLNYKSLADQDIYKKIINSSLNFQPGTRYEYNNSNYYLLSLILEQVTGGSLEDYFTENIFKPLDMKNTGVLKPEVKNISIDPNPPVIDMDIDEEIRLVSLTKGAGYLYSNLEDLYKWDRALYTNKLISKKSLNKMIRPRLKINNNIYGAYGFRVKTNKKYGSRVYQTGNTPGFTTSFNRYIDKNITIIMMTNIGEYNISYFVDPVEKIIFNKDLAYEKNPRINSNILGSYRIFPAVNMDFYQREGELYFKLNKFKEGYAFPIASNELVSQNTKLSFKFNRGKNMVTNVRILPYNIVGVKFK